MTERAAEAAAEAARRARARRQQRGRPRGGRAELESRWGSLDGVLHAIAYAPEDALGGRLLNTGYESAAEAFRTSAYSLQALARHLAPLLERERRGRDRRARLRRVGRLARL